jgi:hypothetical protein
MEENMQRCKLTGMATILLIAPPILQGESPRKPDVAHSSRLVQQLGHDQFGQREAASKKLKHIGAPALKALQAAANSNGDPEVQRRAALLVKAIEGALPFFNGKDLTGWQGLSGHWSVNGGAIIGTTKLHGGDGLPMKVIFRKIKFRELARKAKGNK